MKKQYVLSILAIIAMGGGLFLFSKKRGTRITFDAVPIKELAKTSQISRLQTNEFVMLRSVEACTLLAHSYVGFLPADSPDLQQCEELMAKTFWLAAHPTLANLKDLVSEDQIDTDFGPRASTFLTFWSDHLNTHPKSFSEQLQFVFNVRSTYFASNGPIKISAMAAGPLKAEHFITNQPWEYVFKRFTEQFHGTSTTGLSDVIVAKDHPGYSSTVTNIAVVVFCAAVKFDDTDLATPLMFAYYRSAKYNRWMPYCILAADTAYSPLM